MIKIFGIVLVVLAAMSLFATDGDTTGSYSIEGRLIPYEATDVESSIESVPTPAKSVDLSKARVVVSRRDSANAGVAEVDELVAGSFVDGNVHLEGEVAKPTPVRISVDVGKQDPLSISAVIAPGEQVSFVLKENPAPYPAQIEMFGASRMAIDATRKFTIFGDLSSIELDLEGAIVDVQGGEYDQTGERISLNFGKVMLDNGKFIVEAEIDEPKVVNVLVLVMAEREYTQFHAVVEPGSKIEVLPQGALLYDLFPASGTGRHAHLLESWRLNEEYLTTKHEYWRAYRAFQDASTEVSQTSSDGSDDSISLEKSVESPEANESSRHLELKRKLNRFRYDFLEDIATNATDPIDKLLALELGAFWGDEEALPIYDMLAKTLSKDIVVRRVTSDRNNHARHLASVGTDKSLAVGKRVPDFTLPDLKETDRSLQDILNSNDVVLIDFWASWCGPCIESIPTLKEVYATYKRRGLEIVSVSTDDDKESWLEISEELELPWINLGELEGWEGEVATSYGVTFIPKAYLVDTNGIIIQKNLTPEQLAEYLAEEYGVSTSQDP
ncbi:MAG: TlpA disulfide reductase family protein [Gammaproteobacteria bacterium]|nr:TlpA disulfide reductase family protein [Gammaproteobacteria bacterium]